MRISITLLLLLALNARADTLPQVSSGRIERLADFPSQHIGARTVDVWLPDGYPAQNNYAVLYMHDGQMLFDANKTWNHQEWRVDEVASALIRDGVIRPFIVVGIWNSPTARAAEYFPQKALNEMSDEAKKELYAYYAKATGGKVTEVYSDRYLKFLVNELKPYIDQHYAVATDSLSTFVAGSSMGGLISMYALAEYPSVFGAAACISTHWPGYHQDDDNNPVPRAFFAYIKRYFPAAGRNRIYFDYGNETLDATYGKRQQTVDQLLSEKGFSERDWRTASFPGAAHSEKSWSARLGVPLMFLLSPPSVAKQP